MDDEDIIIDTNVKNTRSKPLGATQKRELGVCEDSDDLEEEYRSDKWGAGASRIVADHYNTV